MDHFNFCKVYRQVLNKAEEDISMSKHVLQIKVCCYLPEAINKLPDIGKFWKSNSCFYHQ